ncbi:MAG TPA: DUF3137 domain-containing protein [Gemmatimonadaceae bacterium]|nr:DUF3137 domain-containing protein [Gemmatimonadaceae bacterium]
MSAGGGSIASIGTLDAATRAKVQAGCNFVNAEVARLRKRITIIGVVCAVGGIALWVFMGQVPGMEGITFETDPRFPMALAFLVFTFFANQARKELATSYKGIVVKRIVASLGRGLTYSPTSTLTKQQFEAMDLFKESAQRWKSEDEVSGKKEAVAYSLHEVLAARGQRSRRRFMYGNSVSLLIMGLKAAGKNDEEIIFKGLIVKLDFNKTFGGHTVVVPNRESKILGGLFGEAETRKRKAIVRLENPDFENMFSVYSTDDQEARYLITPKLMELVMEAQALLGAELRICFSQNSLFVTVPQDRDRFEVSLLGAPVTPQTAIGDLLAVVDLAERLVETLDLETRIWTKV